MMSLKIENIDIPIESEDIILKGSIYYMSDTPSKAPWIVNLAGFLEHRESKFVRGFSERFASSGYYVLSYDYRSHGETAIDGERVDFIKTTPKIFTDLNEVISWLFKNQSDRLLENKIALFGRSYGGAIILTHGFMDRRIKILIALCTRYDYSTVNLKIPEDLIKRVSPKYFLKNDPLNNKRIFLAHCKDDSRMPFHNVIQIKEHLGLNDENVIIYDTGGHSFKGHRDHLFEQVVKFLKKI